MDSKIAHDERVNFSDRLRSALVDAQQPYSPSSFARAYNLRADGASVTSHAARKWLRGEALPTQEKILILARWLNVHASWLRFGDAENTAFAHASEGADISNAQRVLLNDISSLDPDAQVVVRELVDSFLRLAAKSKGDHSTVSKNPSKGAVD